MQMFAKDISSTTQLNVIIFNYKCMYVCINKSNKTLPYLQYETLFVFFVQFLMHNVGLIFGYFPKEIRQTNTNQDIL